MSSNIFIEDMSCRGLKAARPIETHKRCLQRVTTCRDMSSCRMSCVLMSGHVLQRHTMLSPPPNYVLALFQKRAISTTGSICVR